MVETIWKKIEGRKIECYVFKYLYIITVPICMSLLSCGDSNNTIPTTAQSELDAPGKLILVNPDSINKNTLTQDFVNRMSKMLGLNVLEKGIKEDMCMRIWIYNIDQNFLINIVKDHQVNNCKVMKLGSKMVGGKEYVFIDSEWKNIYPQSGWSNFFDTLNRFKISVIPGKSAKELPNTLTGMSTVQFEIATTNRYKFYEYFEPNYFRKIDEGSIIVDMFLKFLNKEMKVEVYQPQLEPR